MSSSATSNAWESFAVKRINRWIQAGALLTVVAIALCVLDWTNLGRWLAVLGLGLMMWNLHRLGRSGAG